MKYLALLLLFALFLPACDTKEITKVEKPNVLFIAIDDLRPELGCYGGPQVLTPHMDQLASQAIRFDRAYCQVAVCGASRASMLTGILPTASRYKNYLARADEDMPEATTMPEAFKNAGYTTISNGKVFHHKDDSEAESWSEEAWKPEMKNQKSYDPETMKKLSKRKRGRIYEMPDVEDDAYVDGKVAAKTIKDLQRLQKAGKPFFLASGFIRPHMPFYTPKKYWDLYNRQDIQIAENRFRPSDAPYLLKGSQEFGNYHDGDIEVNSDEWHRMMRHGYMASVSYVDKLVGDLMGELERLGLAENTIVVLWGDHGWHLGEHEFWGKHNTLHLSTRVPLVVKVPGKKGGASASLVETSDIYPTLCELAGIQVPSTVQGRSFKKVLERTVETIRENAYSRYGPGDVIITDRFSYTSFKNGEAEMLYDLENDPDENENIVAKAEFAETVEEMKKMLKVRQDEASRAQGGPASDSSE